MPLTVTYQGQTKFEVTNGTHTIVADQPREDGGEDGGMSPVELFVGSVAACVAYFVARYCARHGLSTEGFRVESEWSIVEQPHRVGAIGLSLHFDDPIPDFHRERLLKVAHGCTVHQSIAVPAQVDIRLAEHAGKR